MSGETPVEIDFTTGVAHRAALLVLNLDRQLEHQLDDQLQFRLRRQLDQPATREVAAFRQHWYTSLKTSLNASLSSVLNAEARVLNRF